MVWSFKLAVYYVEVLRYSSVNNRERYTTCGHLLVEHLIPKSWALIWKWSPLCCYNRLTILGRLSTRCWKIAAGTCFHSDTRALVRLGTDVGRLGLAHSLRSNSSQMCSVGLRSGLCSGQLSSSTPISTNHFCIDLALCTGALSC